MPMPTPTRRCSRRRRRRPPGTCRRNGEVEGGFSVRCGVRSQLPWYVKNVITQCIHVSRYTEHLNTEQY